MGVDMETRKLNAVVELRRALTTVAPAHDTPIGLVHPYWARKPFNVIETIIQHLSDENELVVDPFMGSGTTVFAALASQRRAVGSDISPMAQHLVTGILDLVINQEELLPEIRRILDLHAELTLPWYDAGQGRYIERERYQVRGDFADGAYTLELTELVTKERKGHSWSSRRTQTAPELLKDLTRRRSLRQGDEKSTVVDFESIKLPENSRIAIPRGANLAQYFTPENQASINLLLSLIEQSSLNADHSPALKLVLSASLPLLRLSDKKASSQWPYWRPKIDLTSRTPAMVLEARFKQIVSMAGWAEHEILPDQVTPAFEIREVSAQKFTSATLSRKPKLVLTDPPYGDQVPYGEYSAMWNAVLGLPASPALQKDELVRSNALHLQSESAAYLVRLGEAFEANASLIDNDGFLAWFYQDQDLNCWNQIYESARRSGLTLVDVLPLPKQRRSLKTVTSPNATLDGDLLCVFTRIENEPCKYGNEDQAPETRAGTDPGDGTYFGRYARMIASALRSGDIGRLAEQYGSVKRALASGEG